MLGLASSGRVLAVSVMAAAVVAVAVGVVGVSAFGGGVDGPAPVFVPGSSVSTDCGVSVPVRVGPRAPHGPARIDGEDPAAQPTVAPGSEAGGPVYRPGSGIVAGDGSAGDPFVIAGWRLPRVTVANLEAHVVVADNAFEPLMQPTGPGTTEIRNASNVSVVENVGLQRWFAGESPGVCIGGNAVEYRGYGMGARVCQSPDARVVGNEGLRGLALWGSPHAVVEGNAFRERGVEVEGWNCTSNPGPVPDRAAFFDHEIGASNSLDGEPFRVAREVSDVLLGGPAGQVVVHNASNVTVEDVSLNWSVVSYSEDVVVRNLTAEQGPFGEHFLRFERSPNASVRDSSFRNTAVRVEDSANASLVGSEARWVWRAFEFVGSPGARVVDNDLRLGGDRGIVKLRGSHGALVVGNHVEGAAEYGIHVGWSDDVEVRENTVVSSRKFSSGMFAWFAANVTVVDNRFLAPDDSSLYVRTLGISVSDGSVNASHNLADGGEADVVKAFALPAWPDEGGNRSSAWENVVRNVSTAFAGDDEGVAGIHGNNLGPGVDVGVENRDDEEVLDARRNWWGCPDGPGAEECADAEGPVWVDPVLGEPNPDAGPRS